MDSTSKILKYRVIVPLLLGLKKTFSFSKEKVSIEGLPKTFFVTGSGRNGSTLLAMLLNRHPEVFLPPEQYALPYSIMKWHLKSGKDRNKLTNEILKDFIRNNQNWNFTDELIEDIRNNLSELDSKQQDIDGIYRVILQKYGEAQSKTFSLIGDHSPVTTLFYKLIHRNIRDSKYIFLIRNPYDVVFSYKKLKGNPAENTDYAIKKWKNSVKAWKWLSSKAPENAMLVKYEDLVEQPEEICNQIQSFLGLEVFNLVVEKESEDTSKSLGTKEYSYHSNLSKPISNRSVGTGLKNLGKEDISQIRKSLKKELIQFGYQEL